MADEVRAFGVKTGIVQADLSKPDAADDMFAETKQQFDTIDILVLNASVQLPRQWLETTPDEFDTQVTANWKSSLRLMQRFAPEMTERGWGRLLTVGSVQEVRPHPTMIVYASTKAGVANTVRNLVLQLADRGVTVNNLSPGVIETPRTDEPTPPVPDRISQRMMIPAGTEGQPEDITGLALLLGSNAGRYVTGQMIYVDGGMSL